MAKLTKQQRDILELADRSRSDADGWSRVADWIWPHVKSALPTELAETKSTDGVNYMRVTDAGRMVLNYVGRARQ